MISVKSVCSLVFSFFNQKKGFTIIEIIVVMAAMTVISSMGFAAFYTYSRSQAVEQTAQDVKVQIEKAKFSALSQVKPNQQANPNSYCSDASVLTGYRFSVFAQSYTIAAFCSLVQQNIETYDLPGNLSFSQGAGCVISFGTQNNDVREISTNKCGGSGNVANIQISGFAFTKTIRVDNGGNVTIQ